MACLIEETLTKWISYDNWTLLECNLGRWNVGEKVQALQQRLGRKEVELLVCSVCRSANKLYIKHPYQINISDNQIENCLAYSANQQQILK